MYEWLADELLALLAPPEAALQWLPGFRISLALQADTDLRWAFIRQIDGGFWEPTMRNDPSGTGAFVIPVFDRDDLVDLVAWEPEQPNSWYQRTREIDLLGDFIRFRCAWEGKPLKLFSNPAAWLLAAGDGACALDESALLRQCGESALPFLASGDEQIRRESV